MPFAVLATYLSAMVWVILNLRGAYLPFPCMTAEENAAFYFLFWSMLKPSCLVTDQARRLVRQRGQGQEGCHPVP